jgi:two-component system, chemotaxis family, CheB/CheR fusion protein
MASQQSAQSDAPFPIVGIAASAGGLEAFTDLLSHLPPNTGMAFVLVQHLSPDHESLLCQILSRITALPVHEAQDGMGVEPDRVYVIPPNTQMTLSDGMLHLAPRQRTQGRYMPGDVFFKSLAAECKNKAIAVVLSGTDGDGAQGLKTVKVAGGVTFAQCDASAKFDSMPSTAVATGYVDFVLPPQAIAAELVNLSQNPFVIGSQQVEVAIKTPDSENDALSTIFALLRTTTGVDFTYYKPTTLNRRLQRRMLLYKLESLDDYVQYLQAHPDEVQGLYEEILIHVTSFFRDPEVFEQLKEQVFPVISREKASNEPIRIWVAGCSTGEEVYSIAICLLEFFKNRATVPPIQIFATDISEAAIARARSGLFLENQMEGVSQERRDRFFVPVPGGGYQIISTVRELCVFARHNLGGDPPFSNLDLISCRNVLIYLSDILQERILSLFHYSLNLTGFLLLGPSESVKASSDFFTVVDETSKFFTRKVNLNRPLFSFATNIYPTIAIEARQKIIQNITVNFDLAREVDQLISNRYAPLSVVVDDQMNILQVRGDTDPYLKLPSGTTDLNLLQMTREGLATALRTAIYEAQNQMISVRQERIQIEDERSLILNLEVTPFQSANTNALCFLVVFEATPTANQSNLLVSENLQPADLESEIVQLRQALAAATQKELSVQANLQAVIQEHNYLNQNLRVANEEILSSNEELQSTNEELQTAKEELQATNEELNTTNEELRNRNLQQKHDNSDLNNFIGSISIPIVMLTNDLRIRRFTPTARGLFNFIATDVGRPFSDLRAEFDVRYLEPMILEVLETLNAKEQDIQTHSGHWYTLYIRPYRTTDNQIDGVTMVFLDIDTLKRNAAVLEATRNYAETIVETVQTPLIVLDADLRINTANRSFHELFQTSSLASLQCSLFELGNRQFDLPQLRSLLGEVLLHDQPIQNVEIAHHFDQIGDKTLLFSACKLQQESRTDLILLVIEDITERRQLETERLARQQAETDNQIKDEFLAVLSHELRSPLSPILGWAQLLQTGKLDVVKTALAIETIERNAKIQSQLIEDLLDISRIMRGKLTLKAVPVDLVSVISAALETVRLAAETKQINIEVIIADGVQRVLGDPVRLQQVVWNMLSNAVKFTDPAQRIDVQLIQVDGDVQFQVTDTGKGINSSFMPYIFEYFRQQDGSTTRKFGGLGLGLAIARQIIELHGGTIWAESEGEGRGATFAFRIPGLPIDEGLSDATPAQLLPDVSLADLNILVVDDDDDSRTLLAFLLDSKGAAVTVTSSALEALQALDHSQPDILISDIGMPEMDGYELVRVIRANEQGQRLPIIALTAYAGELNQQQAIKAGFQRHFSKPFDFEQLIMAIVELTHTGFNS